MADEHRLFFALWPNDRQREALRDPIKAALSPVEGRAVYRGNWHVTLVFVGGVSTPGMHAAHGATADIRVEPFRLRFDRLEYWARPKIACLLATAVPPELTRLVDNIEAALKGLGYEPEERVFRPHITVARNARPFTPEPLAQPVTLEWSGFELVESRRGARGPEYSPVKQQLRRNS